MLQILIPMSGEKARPNPKPALPVPQTMTPILKMTKTTKPTTNLLAAEAHLPGKRFYDNFVFEIHKYASDECFQ